MNVKNNQDNRSNLTYIINHDLQYILEKYSINVEYLYNEIKSCALGIGDIIYHIYLLKHKLIIPPIVINLSFFNDNIVFTNPLNALQFRIQLIDFLLKNNDLDTTNIKYVFNNDSKINHLYNNLHLLKYLPSINLQVKYTEKLIDEKYIIFHTKCRINNNSIDINQMKDKLSEIYKTLKCKYKIVLLGEKESPKQFESNLLHISTIYEQLELLKLNNQVLDLTIPNIYNDLNFENYKKDLNLIIHAKHNIIVGEGGQLVTVLMFNQNSILNYTANSHELNHFKNRNNFYFDINEYKEKIFELLI